MILLEIVYWNYSTNEESIQFSAKPQIKSEIFVKKTYEFI